MRGVSRPTPGQHCPQDRSGDRSAGHAGGVMTRLTAVVVAVGISVFAAALPAAAQETSGRSAGGQTATAVSVAPSDPMIFGLGLAGLCWLVAGLLALAAGLVLATRRVRRPADGGAGAGITTNTSTSNNRAGGVE